MGENRPDSYILSTSELHVLLMLLGVEQFYGLQTEISLSEKEISETIFDLSRREYIVASEKGLRMKEHLKEILLSLTQSERIIFASKEQEKSICVYLGKQVISLEKQWNGMDSFRIGIQDDWFQTLSDKGYLLEELLADDLLYETEEIEYDAKWQLKDPMSVINIVHKDGSVIAENQLFKRPLKDMILVIQDGEHYFSYSERLLRELVEKEIVS